MTITIFDYHRTTKYTALSFGQKKYFWHESHFLEDLGGMKVRQEGHRLWEWAFQQSKYLWKNKYWKCENKNKIKFMKPYHFKIFASREPGLKMNIERILSKECKPAPPSSLPPPNVEQIWQQFAIANILYQQSLSNKAPALQVPLFPSNMMYPMFPGFVVSFFNVF